jgi:uncharacterized protein
VFVSPLMRRRTGLSTVWVDDADAIAARAVQLGGKLVVPPYGAPGFREAVLADPQGAVFSVSKLTAGA